MLFFFLLLGWVGVHHGIYKSSYHVSKISYFNSPPLPLSFWIWAGLLSSRPENL
jgi:hypothetical protein